jgi:GH15 family glucan-1,4-alpha-glucosidase
MEHRQGTLDAWIALTSRRKDRQAYELVREEITPDRVIPARRVLTTLRLRRLGWRRMPGMGRAVMDRYPPIAEHGLIGDLQSTALVTTDGTIDWFCCPRFDSPSVFASLLDHDNGGHFRIGPEGDDYVARQLYFPDTAILITRFMTPDGVGEVIDFMPVDDVLDASLLMMPLVGFVAPHDPTWLSTLDAMDGELVSDSLVYRYDPSASPDGLRGHEGTFSICTFWYVDALARSGRLEQARLALEKMFTYANHLGLYAEEVGQTGEQLGNFPQAFTHLSLINAAITLDHQLDHGPGRDPVRHADAGGAGEPPVAQHD